MVEDDVMILDSGAEIYVWIGNDATEKERKESLKLAEVICRKKCRIFMKIGFFESPFPHNKSLLLPNLITILIMFLELHKH